MAIHFACLECGRTYDLGDAMAGRRARCKQCQSVFTVPSAAPPIEEISAFLTEEIATQSIPVASPAAVEEISDFLPDEPRVPRRAPASSPARRKATKPARKDGPPRWRAGLRSMPPVVYLVAVLGVLLGSAFFVFNGPAALPKLNLGMPSTIKSDETGELEPDEVADAELDDRPKEAIHKEAVDQHNRWLGLLATDLDMFVNAYNQTRNGGKPDLVENAVQQLKEDQKKEDSLPTINLSEAAIVRKEGILALLRSAGGAKGMLHREASPSIRAAAQPIERFLNWVEDYLRVAYPEPPMPKVGLTFRKVENNAATEAIAEKFWALIPDNQRRSISSGYVPKAKLFRVKFGPCSDPRALADRIDFARVIRVHGQRIVLEVYPLTEEELARGSVLDSMNSSPRDGNSRSGKAAPGQSGSTSTGNVPELKPIPGFTKWTIIFRGNSPEAWNSRILTTRFERFGQPSLSSMRYLRLTRMDTSETIIIAIDRNALMKSSADPGRRVRWNGSADKAYGAVHLGLCEGPLVRGKPIGQGETVAVQMVGNDCYVGSGFGHVPYGDNRTQHFAWKGKRINPTEFEIAYKSEDLTEAERACLIGP